MKKTRHPAKSAGFTKAQRHVYPDNPIQAAAWLGLVEFCLKTDSLLDQFESDTGKKAFWRGSRASSPLDAMIDKACGFDRSAHEKEIIEAFVNWVNKTQWGENPFTGEDYTDEDLAEFFTPEEIAEARKEAADLLEVMEQQDQGVKMEEAEWEA